MAILRKSRGRELNQDGSQERTFIVPIAVASNVKKIVPILLSHQNLYLKAVYLVDQAGWAAHDTDYRTFGLQDRGAAGSGTTAAGSSKNTKITGGTAVTAFVDWDLLATAGYKLTAGSVLALNCDGDGTEPTIDGFVCIVCK
jgi:hypothetical protein